MMMATTMMINDDNYQAHSNDNKLEKFPIFSS